MEILIAILSIIIFIFLVSAPIFFLIGLTKWKLFKFNLLNYLVFGVVISAFIIFIFSWWASFSDQILLSHYGYDFEAMGETERFKEVAIENTERVKKLETGYFGTGWPLKALLLFAYYIPYLLIVYLFGVIIRKKK